MSNPIAPLYYQALLCVLMALFTGALPATMTTFFRHEQRCTGLSLGHNLSMAICGGEVYICGVIWPAGLILPS